MNHDERAEKSSGRLETKEKLEKYLNKRKQECMNGTEHLIKKIQNRKGKMCQWK